MQRKQITYTLVSVKDRPMPPQRKFLSPENEDEYAQAFTAARKVAAKLLPKTGTIKEVEYTIRSETGCTHTYIAKRSKRDTPVAVEASSGKSFDITDAVVVHRISD